MKILAISEHYYPITGGTVTYVVNLLSELAKQGNDIYLITYTPLDEIPKNKWVKEHGYYIYNVSTPKILGYNTRLSRIYFTNYIIHNFQSLILKLNPDVVHVVYGHRIPKIFKYGNKRFLKIWTVQNVPPQEYTLPIKTPWISLNYLLEVFFFNAVGIIHNNRIRKSHYDHIIVPSYQTYSLLSKLKIPENMISVIPNGVNTQIFKPLLDIKSNEIKNELGIYGDPLLLSVAGVVPHKGQLTVLKALSLIKYKYPNLHYINIGNIRDKRYYSELIQEIRNNHLENLCTFLPAFSQETLAKFYNACDLYIQPSYQEGFCMAVLEAICCGKKVIGTNAGEIGRMIKDSGAGLVIEAGSHFQIASCIVNLYQQKHSEEDRIRLYKYASKNFSWASIAKKTIELYKRLLSM